MNKSFLFLVFVNLFFCSCDKKEQNTDVLEFIIPRIIDSSRLSQVSIDSLSIVNMSYNYLNTRSRPIFLGKFSFNDSIIDIIDIDKYRRVEQDEAEYWTDYSHKYDATGLELEVDYDSSVLMDIYKMDNQDENFYNHYPVYIHNSTNSNKIFHLDSDRAYGLQEAVDDGPYYRGWKPIESSVKMGDGDGYWGIVIKPKEYIVLLFKKYSGNSITNLRVRVENGENILVSPPYKGLINTSQFTLDPYEKDGSGVILWQPTKVNFPVFLGAMPKARDLQLEDEK